LDYHLKHSPQDIKTPWHSPFEVAEIFYLPLTQSFHSNLYLTIEAQFSLTLEPIDFA